MFPTDAITVSHELIGASSYTFDSSTTPKTVLNISMQQSNVASITYVNCGTTAIARNYGKDFAANPMAYYCADTININKTGNDNSTVILTYVKRDARIASPSAVVVVSGKVDLATSSAVAMHDLTYVIWMGQIVVILALGIITFLLYLRRK